MLATCEPEPSGLDDLWPLDKPDLAVPKAGLEWARDGRERASTLAAGVTACTWASVGRGVLVPERVPGVTNSGRLTKRSLFKTGEGFPRSAIPGLEVEPMPAFPPTSAAPVVVEFREAGAKRGR